METIKVLNAPIIFKNFSGAETDYNRAGDRNCSIGLPEELAIGLMAQGWNIKTLQRNPDEPPVYFTEVMLNYGGFKPPVVYRIIKNGDKRLLDQDTIVMLDSEDIISANIAINPYNWVVGNKSGIKGYVARMDVYIQEDLLAEDFFE